MRGEIGKENRLSPVIRGGGIPVRRGVKAGWVRRGERRVKFIDKKGRRERARRGRDYVWHQERADNYLY